MNRASITLSSTLLVMLLGTPVPAVACSESMFNSGKALPFQSYLAPRPASVLVYDHSAPEDEGRRETLHAGLSRAGHSVVVVGDAQALFEALKQGHFDVVITTLDQVDAVADSSRDTGWMPQLLPVVARSERNAPGLQQRFSQFMLEGASVGQYLRAINRLLSSRVN